MFGVYLNTFNAPKIVRRIKKVSLEDAIRMLYEHAHLKINKKRKHSLAQQELFQRKQKWDNLLVKSYVRIPFGLFMTG